MGWNQKFIGGHLEIDNKASLKVIAYSKTDNEKVSFCNIGNRILEAWWQSGEVHLKVDGLVDQIYCDSCNCHS